MRSSNVIDSNALAGGRVEIHTTNHREQVSLCALNTYTPIFVDTVGVSSVFSTLINAHDSSKDAGGSAVFIARFTERAKTSGSVGSLAIGVGKERFDALSTGIENIAILALGAGGVI